MNADTDARLNDATARFGVQVVAPASVQAEARDVLEEQPLRIVVSGEPVATLMRTPGDEVDLALGFLLTEGVIGSPKDVGTIAFCRDESLGVAGEVRVTLAAGASVAGRRRYRDVLSSCSLCGDAWMEAFAEGLLPFERPPGRLHLAEVFRLRDRMSAAQPLFDRTGASHAAAIGETGVLYPSRKRGTGTSTVGSPPPFSGLPLSRSADSEPYPETEQGVGKRLPTPSSLVVQEDLGRHNALDKAVGAAVRAGVRLDRSLLFLTSRLSFEMVAKAARAGLSDVAGVSAPSAAAVRLARRLRMFLAGFVRGETMTVYAGLDALAD